MILVSQKDDCFINMDNVTSISIEGYREDTIVHIEINKSFIVGRYDTRGRAQEVLNEILERYETECINKAIFGTEGYKQITYRLPKE